MPTIEARPAASGTSTDPSTPRASADPREGATGTRCRLVARQDHHHQIGAGMSATTSEPAELSQSALPTIPEPPKRGAVTTLRKMLLSRIAGNPDERGLSEEAAEVIAAAVADPAETRKYG